MNQEKWTQQLREKLAEHETAAPEGLWADIEAALNEQSAPAQPAHAQRPKPMPVRSRFVAMRRWAVAASVAMLLLGGGYLWWTTSELSQQAVQPFPATSLGPSGTIATSGTQEGERSVAYSDRTPEILSEEIIQTPPLTPPLEGRGVAAQEKPQITEKPQPQITENPQRQNSANPQRQMAEETQHQLAEETQRQLAEETQRQMAEEPHRQDLDWQQEEDPEAPISSSKRQLTLGLYAMNGLDNKNSSNGVLMADALVKQYMDTYANSYDAAARSSEPVWLAGYEEHQHHHRPITYGLTLSYPFSSRFSLTTGVVYSKLQSDFTQMMRNQQIQQEQTLHYVGIPLSLSYKLWTYRRFRTYLSAGVKADWNVATHLETEGVSQDLPKDHMQWSLNGSLGLQYDLLPQLGCYVEPSLNWYPDNGSAIQNYFKDKPLSFGLQIGLRLCLKE